MSNLSQTAIMIPAQIKAIKNAIGGDRVIHANHEEALAAMEKASAATQGFFNAPMIYGPDLDKADSVAIATLGTRAENSEGVKVNGIKAIVMFGLPSVESFLNDGAEWVAKLIEREAADSIFGTLRAATTIDELTAAADGIATNVSDIVAESRNRDSLDTETFDAVWTSYRKDYLAVKMANLEKALPTKPIVLKAMRSASYAAANPATKAIESEGLFVKLLTSLIRQTEAALGPDGKPLGLDTSAMAAWLANRDSVHLAYNAPTIKALGEIDAEVDF